MRLEALDYICCPACNGNLNLTVQDAIENDVIEGTLDCRRCGRQFKILDGLPNLNFPETLERADLSQQKIYDERAQWYDLRNRLSNIKWGRWQYICMENRVKQRLIKLLDLRENASVLETGTGTGRYLPIIAENIGKKGKLHGSDISSKMLEVGKKKIKAKGIQAELLMANASYLPYRSGIFDAVFHNGGLNSFADKKRAIDEMYRVGKSGAKIVICDEGLPVEKQNTWLGKLIIKRDPMYASQPPVELVPEKIENLKAYFSDTGLSWIIAFKKQ